MFTYLIQLSVFTVYMVPDASAHLDAKPIEQFVAERGYTLEVHTIHTHDDYRLAYHRIPHGKHTAQARHGQPVLLAHGILQSSAAFLAMDNGLAYLLADAGFDVWMTNARGNTYSRKHGKYLNPDSSKEFWDFSFDEVGRYDLPAGIDHILSTTGRKSLSYVGFSLGTTAFWVLGASCPGYMDKVNTMVALAPVARPHSMGMVKNEATTRAINAALTGMEFLHKYEFRPFKRPHGAMIRAACAEGENNPICRRLLSSLTGLYSDNIHYGNTFLSTQYMPAGTSLKTLQHFLQVAKSGDFRQFDYGENGNKDHYEGSATPPEYDLNKVTCPVFFVSSDKDTISVMEDTQWLSEHLPRPPQSLFHDGVKEFQHNDFFYSPNIKEALYDPLVSFLNERVEENVVHSTS